MRLFGTDGIRGEVGKYPLTAENILKLAKAASLVLKKKNSISRVVINKDTRLSGYIFEPTLTAGFISMGVNVVLVGPLPTPALTILSKSLRADFSVMITASHNPFQDNGLKFFSGTGYKITAEEERKIEDYFFNYDFDNFKIKQSNYGKAVRLKDAIGRYSEALKQNTFKNLDYTKLKVVLDCANGAAYKVAPEVLFEIGVELDTLGEKPNGVNINEKCGSLFPEKASKLVKKRKSDVGICLDGDGDRLIIIDEINIDPSLAIKFSQFVKKHLAFFTLLLKDLSIPYFFLRLSLINNTSFSDQSFSLRIKSKFSFTSLRFSQ